MAEHVYFKDRVNKPYEPLEIRSTGAGQDVMGEKTLHAFNYIAAQLWFIRQALEKKNEGGG